MTDLLDTLATEAEIPEGTIPTSAILVVGLINGEGDEALQIVTAGETSITQHLGLLHLAADHLIHDDWDPEP